MSEIRRRRNGPVPQLQVPVNEDAALNADAARLQQMADRTAPQQDPAVMQGRRQGDIDRIEVFPL